MGDILDALLPDGLVELRVETDVRGAHHLDGKLADCFDGARSTVFEGLPVDVLVEVDGGLASENVRLRGTLLLGGGHLTKDGDVDYG